MDRDSPTKQSVISSKCPHKNHSTRITVTTIHTTLPDEFTPLSKITSTQAIQKKFKRTKTLKGTTEK